MNRGGRVKVEFKAEMLSTAPSHAGSIYVRPEKGPAQYVNEDYVTPIENEEQSVTEYRNGARVRAVVEGRVEYTGLPGRVRVVRDDGLSNYFKPEHLTVIEPEYEKGKTYIDDMGRVYHRLASFPGPGPCTWRDAETGIVRSDGFPVRPLRRMVPES